jgi:hypothetical protein
MGTLKIPELKQYIFRKLGHPVVRVEVDNTQLDDCIDEALKTFTESHYDACEIGFLSLSVTAGESTYVLGESIQNVMECINIQGQSGSMPWIMDEPVLIDRPTALNEPHDYYDVTSVEVYRQRMALIETTFEKHILFEFNDVTKKLVFHDAPDSSGVRVLHVIQAAVDTEDTGTVSNSLWLKKYAVALARIQWGVNIGKYEGAVGPGGASFNYDKIMEKGEADKETLLTELEEKYSEPPDPVYA